jgi:hypothetical protein
MKANVEDGRGTNTRHVTYKLHTPGSGKVQRECGITNQASPRAFIEEATLILRVHMSEEGAMFMQTTQFIYACIMLATI